MRSPSDLKLRSLDKSLETSLALWNALLTVNGVLISAYSVLVLVIKDIDPSIASLIALSLLSCLTSIALLIRNFTATKNMFFSIGKQMVSSDDISLSEQKKKKDLEEAVRKHKATNFREFMAKILLFFELALLMIILVLHQKIF